MLKLIFATLGNDIWVIMQRTPDAAATITNFVYGDDVADGNVREIVTSTLTGAGVGFTSHVIALDDFFAQHGNASEGWKMDGHSFQSEGDLLTYALANRSGFVQFLSTTPARTTVLA